MAPPLKSRPHYVLREIRPEDVSAVVAIFKAGMYSVAWPGLALGILSRTAVGVGAEALVLLVVFTLGAARPVLSMLLAVCALVLAAYALALLHQHSYIVSCFLDDMGDVMRSYSQPGWAYFVAESTVSPGRIVGTLSVQRMGPHTAEIRRVATVPAFRRGGVARALLAHAEAWCLKQGYDELVLGTSTAQPPALAMYAAAGFRVLRREPIAWYFRGLPPLLPGMEGVTLGKRIARG